jgi:hypothetical protein
MILTRKILLTLLKPLEVQITPNEQELIPMYHGLKVTSHVVATARTCVITRASHLLELFCYEGILAGGSMQFAVLASCEPCVPGQSEIHGPLGNRMQEGLSSVDDKDLLAAPHCAPPRRCIGQNHAHGLK